MLYYIYAYTFMHHKALSIFSPETVFLVYRIEPYELYMDNK